MFIQENAIENVVCEMASICLGHNVLTSATMMLHNKRNATQCYFRLQFGPIVRLKHIVIKLLYHVSFRWYTFLYVINFNLRYQ